MGIETLEVNKDNLAKSTFLSMLANVSEVYNTLLAKDTITIDENTKILSQIMEAYSFYSTLQKEALDADISSARTLLDTLTTALNNLLQFKGEKGDKGDIGETGATGQNGVDGTNGAKGDTGLQGLQGVKGDNGLNGTNGVDGSITFEALTPEQKATLKGDTGLQGIQGIKGDIGLQGIQGETGIKGDIGLQGIQGIKGDIGLQGIKGDNGLKSAIVKVTSWTPSIDATTTANQVELASIVIPITSGNRLMIDGLLMTRQDGSSWNLTYAGCMIDEGYVFRSGYNGVSSGVSFIGFHSILGISPIINKDSVVIKIYGGSYDGEVTSFGINNQKAGATYPTFIITELTQ